MELSTTSTFSLNIYYSAYCFLTINITIFYSNETITPYSSLSKTDVDILKIVQAVSSLSDPSPYIMAPLVELKYSKLPLLHYHH